MDGWDEVRWATAQAGYDSVELIRRSQERSVSPEVALEGIYRAAAVRAQVAVGELPPFTRFEATPPGMLDARVSANPCGGWTFLPRRIGSVIGQTSPTSTFAMSSRSCCTRPHFWRAPIAKRSRNACVPEVLGSGLNPQS